ncbi:hypothetical protein BCR33DRAFT_528624 [Rhizoclosmatium globosum]|uniref:Uncharacterized protein n=1 Tax=Rhizoclosmatium globosum TaxID=329046 RepID=A0A1Y2CU97_9FUNG|nr:hypothetical protein BCR33DRAFT_528624 [Rhizoclosmatium globosum]|eukprot:ORY50404.1 hypothetical protein BCR33DRAFT_528624 [Rhizoclosmatium globosum]
MLRFEGAVAGVGAAASRISPSSNGGSANLAGDAAGDAMGDFASLIACGDGDGARFAGEALRGDLVGAGAATGAGDGSRFGVGARFGDGSRFGDASRLGVGTRTGDGSRFGDGSRLGVGAFFSRTGDAARGFSGDTTTGATGFSGESLMIVSTPSGAFEDFTNEITCPCASLIQ